MLHQQSDQPLLHAEEFVRAVRRIAEGDDVRVHEEGEEGSEVGVVGGRLDARERQGVGAEPHRGTLDRGGAEI